jgi:hypothetical protein
VQRFSQDFRVMGRKRLLPQVLVALLCVLLSSVVIYLLVGRTTALDKPSKISHVTVVDVGGGGVLVDLPAALESGTPRKLLNLLAIPFTAMWAAVRSSLSLRLLLLFTVFLLISAVAFALYWMTRPEIGVPPELEADIPIDEFIDVEPEESSQQLVLKPLLVILIITALATFGYKFYKWNMRRKLEGLGLRDLGLEEGRRIIGLRSFRELEEGTNSEQTIPEQEEPAPTAIVPVPKSKVLSLQKQVDQALTEHKSKEKFVEKYEVMGDKIGKGAFGVVWKAVSRDNKEIVAVKQFDLKTLKPIEQDFARREIGLLLTLNHDNIVKGKEWFAAEDTWYVVMEYLDGGTLSSYFSEKGVSTEKVSVVTREVLKALSFLHEYGCMHRDIKPDNIMLGRDVHGNIVVKLIDLGMVGPINSIRVCGSTGYLAPEMENELKKKVEVPEPKTEAVDIYSLGATLQRLCLAHDSTILKGDLLDFIRQTTDPSPIARGKARDLLDHHPLITGLPRSSLKGPSDTYLDTTETLKVDLSRIY